MTQTDVIGIYVDDTLNFNVDVYLLLYKWYCARNCLALFEVSILDFFFEKCIPFTNVGPEKVIDGIQNLFDFSLKNV